jgi:enoyl-CoA hydratase
MKEQHGLTEEQALANELLHGRASLDPHDPDGAVAGARRFAMGAGRHGSPS